MSLATRKHLNPEPLTPAYGTLTVAGSRPYFRSVNKPLVVGGSVLIIGALLAQLLPPAIRSNIVVNGVIAGMLGLYSVIGFLHLRNKFRMSTPAIILGFVHFGLSQQCSWARVSLGWN